VTDVTWTFTYLVELGHSASVDQSTTIAAGTAVVTVYDALGTQVYTQSLSANGTFDTSAGVAGNWTIKVAFRTTTARSTSDCRRSSTRRTRTRCRGRAVSGNGVPWAARCGFIFAFARRLPVD
jgi:hypothetical protein